MPGHKNENRMVTLKMTRCMPLALIKCESTKLRHHELIAVIQFGKCRPAHLAGHSRRWPILQKANPADSKLVNVLAPHKRRGVILVLIVCKQVIDCECTLVTPLVSIKNHPHRDVEDMTQTSCLKSSFELYRRELLSKDVD